MAMLGYDRDDMLAVHPMKTYFYQFYRMDVRSGLCRRLISIKWMLHGIIVLERFLTLVGVKVLSHWYFIAILCLLYYWLNREK